MKKWRCTICGYVHEGDEPPEKCPVCGADKSLFEEVIEKARVSAGDLGQETPAAESPQVDPRAVDMGPEPTTPLGRMLYFAMGQILKHHLHPISVHIPNGLVPVTFIFMVLSVLLESRVLETAAYCNLVFVVLSMPVVLYTGYVEWQKRYQGLRSRLFMIKIVSAVIVFGVSVLLVLWWTVNPDILQVPSSGRTVFMLANLLSLGAAGGAGHIGGKLVFRD